MKIKYSSTLLAAAFGLALSGSANAAIIAGWDAWADTTVNSAQADVVETGFTATAVHRSTGGTTSRFLSGFTSNDGTYGNVSGASTSDSVAFLPRGTDGNNLLTITLTNNSGSAYFIDSINFDFEVRNGPTSFVVDYVSGGLGPDGTEIGSASGLSNTGYNSGGFDYNDFDYALGSVLTDTELGNGESATFTITFEAGTANDSSAFDNLAFQGSVVPEPSAALLGALGLLALLRRRR